MWKKFRDLLSGKKNPHEREPRGNGSLDPNTIGAMILAALLGLIYFIVQFINAARHGFR